MFKFYVKLSKLNWKQKGFEPKAMLRNIYYIDYIILGYVQHKTVCMKEIVSDIYWAKHAILLWRLFECNILFAFTFL